MVHKNSLHDCKPFVRISEDEGSSWSEAHESFPAPGYFVLNNDRVVQVSSGRLIMSLAYCRGYYDGQPGSLCSIRIRKLGLDWIR